MKYINKGGSFVHMPLDSIRLSNEIRLTFSELNKD